MLRLGRVCALHRAARSAGLAGACVVHRSFASTSTPSQPQRRPTGVPTPAAGEGHAGSRAPAAGGGDFRVTPKLRAGVSLFLTLIACLVMWQRWRADEELVSQQMLLIEEEAERTIRNGDNARRFFEEQRAAGRSSKQ
jgi:hypothetical protein